jgi:hypothetical protein
MDEKIQIFLNLLLMLLRMLQHQQLKKKQPLLNKNKTKHSKLCRLLLKVPAYAGIFLKSCDLLLI